MGDYWLKNVRPDLTLDFARATDSGFATLFQTCTDMNVSAWSSIAQERVRLPMRMKECGLRGAADRQYAQYIRDVLQSTSPLMDRKDESGCVTRGRLNLAAIATLFGDNAFDYPCPAPWQGVLGNSRPAANIASGLRFAWSQLQTNF